MKKIHLFTIIIAFWSLSTYSQFINSDSAYSSTGNQNSTGNLSGTGVNANKVIAAKLQEVNKRINEAKTPEGWSDLLKATDAEVEKERKEKLKKDYILNDLDYKKKLISIEKQETENFQNKMITYLTGMIGLILLILLIKKLFIALRKNRQLSNLRPKFSKLNLWDMRKISSKEIIFMSIACGILISIISGSLFYRIKYYRLFKGYSVEVSKEISTFELHEFNYLIAIIFFILFTGISYFYLNCRKRNNRS